MFTHSLLLRATQSRTLLNVRGCKSLPPQLLLSKFNFSFHIKMLQKWQSSLVNAALKLLLSAFGGGGNVKGILGSSLHGFRGDLQKIYRYFLHWIQHRGLGGGEIFLEEIKIHGKISMNNKLKNIPNPNTAPTIFI